MPNDRLDAQAYEMYIGRWSRLVSDDFLAWLDPLPGTAWLDVACGTGALAQAILAKASPQSVRAYDLAPAYIALARATTSDPRASYDVADALALPDADATYDAAVSGLPFPAIPDPQRALAELARVAKPGALVGAFVWDFAGGMQLLHRFWEAANAFDPGADEDDDDERFRLCRPDRLAAALRDLGLRDVETTTLDTATRFRNFDDYWTPFLRGQAPAQAHVGSLDDERRARLRERLRATLPTEPDGSIPLVARAYAVKGSR